MAEETVNTDLPKGELEPRKPFEVVLTPAAIPYLRVQQGRISHIQDPA
jgi:hypothetical protein